MGKREKIRELKEIRDSLKMGDTEQFDFLIVGSGNA